MFERVNKVPKNPMTGQSVIHSSFSFDIQLLKTTTSMFQKIRRLTMKSAISNLVLHAHCNNYSSKLFGFPYAVYLLPSYSVTYLSMRTLSFHKIWLAMF